MPYIIEVETVHFSGHFHFLYISCFTCLLEDYQRSWNYTYPLSIMATFFLFSCFSFLGITKDHVQQDCREEIENCRCDTAPLFSEREAWLKIHLKGDRSIYYMHFYIFFKLSVRAYCMLIIAQCIDDAWIAPLVLFCVIVLYGRFLIAPLLHLQWIKRM